MMGVRMRNTQKLNGFTLVEVMIALGMISVGILAMSSMMQNGQWQAQSIQRRVDYIELQSFIRTILDSSPVCTASLARKSLPTLGGHVPPLSFGSGTSGQAFDDSTAHNMYSNIKITSLVYGNPTPIGSAITVPVILTVDLMGTGTKTVVGGNTPKSVSFPLIVHPVAGVIGNCGTAGGPLTVHNLTGSRALNTTYQNTSGQTIFLTGSASTNGSSTGTIKCSAGPSFPAITLFENEATATMNYGRAAFACMIPDTYYYQISSSGAVGWPPASPIHEWIETMLPF